METFATAALISAEQLAEQLAEVVQPVVIDCRFVLGQPAAGREQYLQGHISGAHYLHLEADLSGPVGRHGGRHPLPDPAQLAATLAALGVDKETPVVAYDDSRFAFAARFWWLLRALGYRAPALLNGGYAAWLAAAGAVEQGMSPAAQPCAVPAVTAYRGVVNIQDLAELQAAGAVLVDSRDPARFAGLEEPLDPFAGHIPGAVNLPWQGTSDTQGFLLADAGLKQH
ncbi:MAG: rhodanese-like domain-containing protein, partial [Haliea sp.]|nr:rhodanese-like domain-containing protein [Haliea sp.]